jgi:hypothetical protein
MTFTRKDGQPNGIASGPATLCRYPGESLLPNLDSTLWGGVAMAELSEKAADGTSNLRGSPMTQQYIVGELSELISLLEPVWGEWLAGTVYALRRQVECSPVADLAPLAAEAMTVADMVCWVSLEEGDTVGFGRQSAAAVRLHEFAVSANLLP